ncbi:MAG: glycosyltransferase [Gammaproteobacteria bacterium]|nr:glycosyltransferase [Gammaproteobacteria bacterium]
MHNKELIATFFSSPQNVGIDDIGISGGGRIFIESIKRWADTINSITILTDEPGEKLLIKYLADLSKFDIKKISVPKYLYNSLFLLFLWKTLAGIYLTIKTTRLLKHNAIVFSTSDIFPDLLPAYFAKLVNRKIKWVSAFYFFASNPFTKEFPYKGLNARIRGAIYYYTQRICYKLIKARSDYVVACNEIDRKIFIKDGYNGNSICPIYGGVDLSIANSVPSPDKIVYDAVFMARLHAQKGPMIAVKAWRELLKFKKDAKLALIGNGPEEESIRKYICKHNLNNNVTMMGFMDGVAKYEVLKASKVFLHASVYETGGMAAAEGMAAGLPVVAFDHEGFDYCYPKGMVRIKSVGDYKAYAEGIKMLLENKSKFDIIKNEAKEFSKSWDWDIKAKYLLNELINC